MFAQKAKTPAELAQFIEQEIKIFVRTSPANRLPNTDNLTIFDEPLVQFADGDDPIFAEYKTIIDPTHLTPREVFAKTFNKDPEDMPAHLSVISFVLPITGKIRESNRQRKLTPSRQWSHARWYGEKLSNAVREHVVKLLTEMGYLAVAPVLQPYFKVVECDGRQRYYSNWSERHIAYAAGLGTFSLSDGFITERGIAHRCGSVVTNLVLPPSPRTAKSPYSNCLFYVNAKCHACIVRCPAEALTENGHNKLKCDKYIFSKFQHLSEKYGVGMIGCGLCQTKVPCESRNPTTNLKKTG